MLSVAEPGIGQCHRMRTIPVPVITTIGGSIFKVAVLNQLRIQSTVGGIIDVFKEDAYQMMLIFLPASAFTVTVACNGFNPTKRTGSCAHAFGILQCTIALMLGIADGCPTVLYAPLSAPNRPVPIHLSKQSLPTWDIHFQARIYRGRTAQSVPTSAVGRKRRRPAPCSLRSRPYTMPTSIGTTLHQMRLNIFLCPSHGPEIRIDIGKTVSHTKPFAFIGAPGKP